MGKDFEVWRTGVARTAPQLNLPGTPDSTPRPSAHSRMPTCFARRLFRGILVSLAVWGAPVSGQERGAYLPLSDPASALTEQLVARGVLTGLASAERPFLLSRLRDALGTVERDGLSPGDAERVEWLARLLGERLSENRWEATLAPDLGVETGTQARRQLLLPGGEDDLWFPLVRLRGGAEFGPFSLQFAPQQEPRVRDDPDRPTVSDLGPVGSGVTAGRVSPLSASLVFRIGALRLPAALLRGEWRWASLEWGELERNWGPPGVPGLHISSLGYHRPEFGFSLGPRKLAFQWRTAPLSRGTATVSGNPVARWWSMHRLRWRPSDRLELAVWETSVTAEEAGPDASRWFPLTPFNFGKQLGNGDARNPTLGVDATWRASPSLLLEGQFLLDDLIWEKADRNPYPHRLGFTLQARGPLGGSAAWRTYLTGLSGLALITRTPEEAYLDDGVGLGRLRPDHFEAGASVTLPWMIGANSDDSPLGIALAEFGLRWRRQGIRSFTDPFPDLESGPDAEKFPTWSPEIEREVWALVSKVDAQAGRFTVQWEAHLQHRSFPASGAGSEWGAEALVRVVLRLGLFRMGGEG